MALGEKMSRLAGAGAVTPGPKRGETGSHHNDYRMLLEKLLWSVYRLDYSPLDFNPMGNLKTAHVCASVRTCVRPSIRSSVTHHISEMAGWIHLKFYSRITYIPGVMQVFTDFEKS